MAGLRPVQKKRNLRPVRQYNLMNGPHLFRESGEKISSSEEVQDQVELPFSLKCYKYTQVSLTSDSTGNQEGVKK